VATAAVSLSRDKAPLGSPVEFAYRFVVAPDAHITEDYRVMVHIVDADEQLVFTFDHDPPVPTTQWKPGQTVAYSRTEFIPIYPYVGDAAVQIGLYSPATQKRLPLAGEDAGQHAYKVARFQLQPQTENLFLIFKDGWHPAESAENNAKVEWQWTKKAATLAFKNPKRDATVYLSADNPGGIFNEPQHVRVTTHGAEVGAFTVTPGREELHKLTIPATVLGDEDMVEVQLEINKTFVPAQMPSSNSKDGRELGVRVFHAFVEPAR